MSAGSVSHLIKRLKTGSDGACLELWNRYCRYVERRANLQLLGVSQQVEDAEDIVVAALEACFRAIAAGRHAWVREREGFLRLLNTISDNKVKDQKRRIGAEKRGDGRNAHIPFYDSGDSETLGAERFALSREASPELDAILADELERLMGMLDDELLRRVATFRLEGLTHAEIADRVERSIPSIERYCRLIREVWGQEATDD